MKRLGVLVAFGVGAISLQAVGGEGRDGRGDREGHRERHRVFAPGSLVLSRSVYAGDAGTVTPGQTLPPSCKVGTVSVPLLGGGNASIKVKCATAVADGTYPGVFDNNKADGSFGITSPIFLDNLTLDGDPLSTYAVPTDQLVTSFSSKSELAINLSAEGDSLTFVGYRGGPGFVTGPNQLDVSNSSTPGVVDPTNPVVSQYYRAVAEIDAEGHLAITEGNAYSGNNGRAAMKARGLYYLAGNDNNGGLSSSQLTGTQIGLDLVSSTGAELLVPGAPAPLPPAIAKIGDFEITQVGYQSADKAGKDNNFRGLTIFEDTLYVTKGSGGNGINTVYQVGAKGALPTGTAAQLSLQPITILPGFPTSLASGVDQNGNPTPVAFPFGLWFANASTLYVCDEGDGALVTPAVNGNVADAATRASAGVQKWSLVEGTWQLDYVLQEGLDIGVPYAVEGYPEALSPATGGCRNLTGQVDDDGIATIYAVTSTLSPSGDQGADPNKLVKVTDRVKDRALHVGKHRGRFSTLRTAQAGEVLRGVAFAPGRGEHDDGE